MDDCWVCQSHPFLLGSVLWESVWLKRKVERRLFSLTTEHSRAPYFFECIVVWYNINRGNVDCFGITMADRLSSSSFILLGGALAIIALWVLTSLAVNWDTRQRNLPTSERNLWVTITILLPLFGFALYLAFRVFRGYFSIPRQNSGIEEAARKTAVKSAYSQAIVQNQTQTKNDPESILQPAWGIESAVRSNGKHKEPVLTSAATTLPAAQKSATGSFVLSVLDGPYYGQQFFLLTFPILIGRGSEVSIPLDGDLNVSRRHAEIYEWGGMISIRDLQSMHGTKVNGKPVREKVLSLGDKIQIGATILLLGEVEQHGDRRFRG
jgi:pSer/pThr/pTyr-binding forkhead associated (FHA) protein